MSGMGGGAEKDEGEHEFREGKKSLMDVCVLILGQGWECQLRHGSSDQVLSD